MFSALILNGKNKDIFIFVLSEVARCLERSFGSQDTGSISTMPRPSCSILFRTHTNLGPPFLENNEFHRQEPSLQHRNTST